MDCSPAQSRFVVLRHEGVDPPHYDLMFELSSGGSLATWRSDVWPIVRPTPLVKLDDHRREYLSYEGPLTGGRGFVRRVAGGRCRIERPGETQMRIAFLDQPGGLVLRLRNGDWSACSWSGHGTTKV
jgi:hypothetical protein